MTIQLLVSVRDSVEALEAAEGGADIVDIKDPSRGPLGYAGSEVISEVLAALKTDVPVSAALGEAFEWCDTPNQQEMEILSQLKFLKPGPQGLASAVDWPARLKALRDAVSHGISTQWVAVSYADYRQCDAPPPREILRHADSYAGFLIDTFDKAGGSTFDNLEFSELRDLREACRGRGLFFALAGRIQSRHLENIAELQPDIVGVRGAVCEQNDRTGRLTRERVSDFRSALDGICVSVTS